MWTVREDMWWNKTLRMGQKQLKCSGNRSNDDELGNQERGRNRVSETMKAKQGNMAVTANRVDAM